MLAEGISSALIENSARAAGMKAGPLRGGNSAAGAIEDSMMTGEFNVERLKQRFLCIQAVAAAGFVENGSLDAVEADLNSILAWGYPSYTGGVMSYIDTMGAGEFVALSDQLAVLHGGQFTLDKRFRQRILETGRIYPVDE